MHIVRTVIWVLILAGVLIFSWANWDERVTVNIWNNLVWETRLPAVVIVSFLLGHLPMWLYHRGQKWGLSRRIRSLENAVKSNALARHAPTPTAGSETSTPAASPAATPAPASALTPNHPQDTLNPSKDPGT